MKLIERIKDKIRGTTNLDKLKKMGLKYGLNFHVMQECIIDPGHCFLISIGDNVTLAPRVHILAHDASTKKFIGYTRIAKVTIGNNVFIGAGSIILPGVTIGDNVIVGAGSVVTKDIPSNVIVAGNPATKIKDFDVWIKNKKDEMKDRPVFDEKYIILNIDENRKQEMKNKLNNGSGYII